MKWILNASICTPVENDEKCRRCAQHAAHGKCQNAKRSMRGPQEAQSTRPVRMRGHQVQVEPANVIKKPKPDQEPPKPTIPEELKDGHGDDVIPKSNERKTDAVAGRDRGGVPTRRGAPVHGLGGERPRPDHGNAHQDQLRPQGLAPSRQASDRLLEGGIILRRHQAGPHEMQTRRRHARSNGHLGDEEQRHRDEETCERGEVQQQRLPRSRSEGEPFPPGENQKRDPGDSQKRDDPPSHRRSLFTNQADPLHEPISWPAPFDVQFTFVGNDRVHCVVSRTLNWPFRNAIRGVSLKVVAPALHRKTSTCPCPTSPAGPPAFAPPP